MPSLKAKKLEKLTQEKAVLERCSRFASCKPRFVKIEPPSDADIAEILQQISRRVIHTLRRLGYLVQGRSFQVGEGWHSNVNAVRFGNSSPRIPKETHVRC